MTLDVARLAAAVEARLLELPRATRRGDEIVFRCLRSDRHTNGDAHPSASYSTAKRAHRCKACGLSGGLVRGDAPIATLLGIDADDYRDGDGATRQAVGRPDRSWEIRDREGRTVAIHHRRDLEGGRKRVWWAMPDGSIGLGGAKAMALPLYASERLGARESGDDSPTFLCEGEPATDALLALGLRAVGTVTGASSLPSIEALEILRGADVVLWPDADGAGRAHMRGMAALLSGVAASVRIFEPDGLPAGGDAADWAEARSDTPDLGMVLLGAVEEHATSAGPEPTRFEGLADDAGYRLVVPALGACLELSYLRRERHQLRGEVLTRCTLPGAATFDGVLSVAETNLSSTRSRREHADHLAAQARTDADPWRAAVEELAQRALAAERAGEPDVSLPDVVPEAVRIVEIEGIKLPRAHPAVIFGDGDSAKSYLALYILGRLAAEGLRVGLADWELSEGDHRDRLGRLFPGALPPVRYLRCARPIVHEADRLRRWVRDRKLDYVVMDSVAYASAGAPESAEVAMGYFQVVRQLGPIGSLHVAHITKAQEGADRRPFGSAFWHNSPRATWYVKLADRDPGGTTSRLGLYPRKWNLGPLPASVGLELLFAAERTTVRRIDLAAEPDLAAHLSVRHRMVAALRAGPLPLGTLAEEIGAPPDTVRRTAQRYRDQFCEGAGKTLHLMERRS